MIKEIITVQLITFEAAHPEFDKTGRHAIELYACPYHDDLWALITEFCGGSMDDDVVTMETQDHGARRQVLQMTNHVLQTVASRAWDVLGCVRCPYVPALLETINNMKDKDKPMPKQEAEALQQALNECWSSFGLDDENTTWSYVAMLLEFASKLQDGVRANTPLRHHYAYEFIREFTEE